jgi:predicted DNA-binding transcriptional regulator AlpA
LPLGRGLGISASGAAAPGRRGTRTTVSPQARGREGYGFAVQVDSRTELVIGVEIARRLGISPQRVNVLAAGPGFPTPLGKLGRSSVWRWSSVERWARETGRLPVAEARE